MHGLQDIGISFTLEFEDNPLTYERGLHLPSTKLENSFHVNKRTFEISKTQSQFHQNGTSTEGMVMLGKDIIFSPSD
jgi:hypothetical protein